MCEPTVLSYIKDDMTIWEQEPLYKMSKEGELSAWVHKGFWQPMDTLRERKLLDQLIANSQAPWVTWK